MDDTELKLKRLTLHEKIDELPDDKLESVVNFIETCLGFKEKKNIAMQGIWKGLGFENMNLEKEVQEIRKTSLQDLKRKFN